MSILEIIHDKDNNQFTMEVKGEQAKVEYTMKNDTMHLIYSEVPFNLRGQGIGKELVEKTFEKLTEEGYKAVAVCAYVKSVARESEKWRSIIG